MANRTCHGLVVSLAGASTPEVVDAILSVLALDDSVAVPVCTMRAATDSLAEVQNEVQAVIDADGGRHLPMGVMECLSPVAACGSYAVMMTGERRLVGNVLTKRGVVSLSN